MELYKSKERNFSERLPTLPRLQKSLIPLGSAIEQMVYNPPKQATPAAIDSSEDDLLGLGEGDPVEGDL